MGMEKRILLPVLVGILILGSLGLSQTVLGQNTPIDLIITKSVSDPFPEEGDTITYTISLVNLGPFTATNVLATDDLTSFFEVNIIDESPTRIDVGTWDPINGVWSISSLVAGKENKDEVILQFRADVRIGAAGFIKSTITVTADELNTVVSDSATVLIQSTGLIEIDIEIKPGSDPNCFKSDVIGIIPVAIFGSNSFDVTLIDTSTIKLDGMAIKTTGKENTPLSSIKDVNGDGFDDLVVKIKDSSGVFDPGIITATLTGELLNGTLIEGSDSICIK